MDYIQRNTSGGASEMTDSIKAKDFIEHVRSNYDGRATLEIELKKVTVDP